jgi:hypothetical protein
VHKGYYFLMPLIDLGRNVVLIPSAGSVTIYRSLCIPVAEEDREYLRSLDHANINVVYFDAYEPEWGMRLTDGRYVDFGEAHRARHAGPEATMRFIVARVGYIVRQRARQRLDRDRQIAMADRQIAVCMCMHARLGVGSPMLVLDKELVDVVAQFKI